MAPCIRATAIFEELVRRSLGLGNGDSTHWNVATAYWDLDGASRRSSSRQVHEPGRLSPFGFRRQGGPVSLSGVIRSSPGSIIYRFPLAYSGFERHIVLGGGRFVALAEDPQNVRWSLGGSGSISHQRSAIPELSGSFDAPQ